MPLARGAKLGTYEIIAAIGFGGMGEVYRARDAALKRDVAIKVLPPAYSADAARLYRFQQEAEATAALNHPNILSVYSVGQHDGIPYIVTELLEGESLRQKIANNTIGQRKAFEYAIQIAAALAGAHEKGIVHRDLKPDNIFVTQDDRVKILDFGLAKLLNKDPERHNVSETIDHVTGQGQILGTVGYMAPEQIRGQAADARSDIFAFGAVLFELFTGKPAFKRDSAVDTQSAVLKEDPADFESLQAKAAPALERIVRRCLEKSPHHRFQNTLDLRFALEAFAGATSDIRTSVVDFPIGPRISTWWKAIAGVVLLAALVVAAALGFQLIASRQPVVENIFQLTNDGLAKYNYTDSSLVSDGSRLYFNEGQSGNWRIAQVSTSGGESVPLATSVTNPLIADIAADSSSLLAISGGMNLSQLWLIPLPAGNPQPVGDLRLQNAVAMTTRDGNRILYNSGSSVNVAGNDGSDAHKLFTIAGAAASATSSSPDGKRLRFTVWSQNFAGSLWESGAEGENQKELLKDWTGSQTNCCGKWTADGRYYVFQAWDAGRWDLWAIPGKENLLFHSKRPMRLTAGPLSYQSPLPGRDNRSLFAIGTLRRGEVTRYDKSTNQVIPLVSSLSAIDLSFARNADWMIYTSFPDHMLWRSRTDGREPLQLTRPPEYVLDSSISPDGTLASFSSWNAKTGTHLYVVSTQGGSLRKIADNVQTWSSWSPDGKLLAFETSSASNLADSDEYEIKLLDLATSAVRPVPGSQGKQGRLWATPNKLVSTAKGNLKLFIYDLATQRWSELVVGSLVNVAKTSDGTTIYAEQVQGRSSTVVKISLLNGSVEKVLGLDGIRRVEDQLEGTWFGVAPDNSILLTRDLGTQEIYSFKIDWP